MLVLSRKIGEGIRIGSDVEIKILEIKGDTIKIGIVAPKDLSIWRNELFEEISAENLRAATRSVSLTPDYPWSEIKKNQ
jgi:carbon storage regulator